MDDSSNADDAVDEIKAAIFAGRKIPAIKLYREMSGAGLKEAKDFVEALEAELRQSSPQQFTAPPTSGCGVLVLLVTATLTALGVAMIVLTRAV